MDTIKDILTTLGYSPVESNGFYRMAALYRDGNNPSTLSVNKVSGYATDFATGEVFPLISLVARTLNCSEKEAQKLIKNLDLEVVAEKKMELAPTFEMEELKTLLPAYYFYNNRGISTETLKEFGGGYCSWGRMSDRFCFKVYGTDGILRGVAGRDVTGTKTAKWKNLGKTKYWSFPTHINYEVLREKRSIILLESVGDCLALWQAGIKNILVLFGVSVGNAVLETILSVNPLSITISTNNDKDGGDGRLPGQEAAIRIKEQLSKWFSPNIIQIKLPTKKDFGEMTKQEIQEWNSN